jgi:hypothetical protein
MSETPPDLVTVTLTCHTSGCGNEGEAIQLEVPNPLGAAICGACGNPIEVPPEVRQEGNDDS